MEFIATTWLERILTATWDYLPLPGTTYCYWGLVTVTQGFHVIVNFCYWQIIIHGTTEATKHLSDFAGKTLGISKDKIFSPGIGECVDATTESHIYQVRPFREESVK